MAHPVPAAAVPVVLWLARAGQGCTGCALPFPFLTWCGCATRVVLRREGDSPPPPTGGPACPGLAMGSGCAVAPLLRACWSGNRPAAPQCPTCSHGTHYSPSLTDQGQRLQAGCDSSGSTPCPAGGAWHQRNGPCRAPSTHVPAAHGKLHRGRSLGTPQP